MGAQKKLQKHMKNYGLNKTKEFAKNNLKFLIIFISLSIVNVFFLCLNFASNDLYFGKTFFFLIVGSILIEVILCSILFLAKQKEWKIEKTFLVVGIIVGIIYTFALPIGRAPDEESHFFRIYEITNGKIVSDTSEKGQNGSLQASNIEIIRDFKEKNVNYIDIINNISIYPDDSEESFVRTSAGSYSPISYLPHILGMGLGKILHLPLLVNAYIAKIFNLIICIAVIYFSMKFIPFLKEMIFFIAFLPITMQSITSLSADGFIISTAIALISLTLYSIYIMNRQFTKKQLFLITILCLILSLSKIVYSFLCLILFTIPKERFGNNKKKIITIFSIGGFCLFALLFWFFLSAPLDTTVDPTNKNILLSNPLTYFAILINSISVNMNLYLSGTLGGYLEWFNVVLSPIYLLPSFIIFVLLCKKSYEKNFIHKNIQFFSIIIFTIISLLIFTSMFTQWTKPGEVVIDGVQGRYFVPILLLIPLSFSSKLKKPTEHLHKLSVQKMNRKLGQNYYLYEFFIFESIYAIISIVCSHL